MKEFRAGSGPEASVARTGPRSELLLPLSTTPWECGENGFELRVAARDPNGVARVTCRVERKSTAEGAITCTLVPDGDSALGALWRGSVDLPMSWSRADVKAIVEAEDAYGAKSITTLERVVGVLRPKVPARLQVTFAGRIVAPMRLVRGNANNVYVFGGRGDDLEDELFRRSGLYEFNALQTARSWQVSMPPGSIADYYLDEHEVTVEEFAEFLRAPDGYDASRNWIAGGGAADARKRDLVERARTTEAKLPMTDVTWFEASAYARWVRKSLPSALEWEHAVRGGSAYRPYSAWSAESPRAKPKFLDADRLSPVGTLDDVANDTGLLDLSGNASEWTSTVATSSSADPTASSRDDAITSSSDSMRYWVAGGSWSSSRRDFSTFDRRRCDARSRTIGFRCRLSAAEFLERLEDRSEPRFVSSFP